MKVLDMFQGKNFCLYNGDSTEIMTELEDESIHFSVFSPPFSSLYVYSNSDRDLGNSKNDDEFFEHFRYIVSELYRILKFGRLVSVHCMNLPTSKERDGYIGLKDFRGGHNQVISRRRFYISFRGYYMERPSNRHAKNKGIGVAS